MQVQFSGWEDPLEKQMATHSVFLPGKSHRQRSLGGYSPEGYKRVVPDSLNNNKAPSWLGGCSVSFPFNESNFLIFQKLQLSVAYVRSCVKEQNSLGEV